MKLVRYTRRLTVALTGLACVWLGLASGAPAAFATRLPMPGEATVPGPPGVNKHPPFPAQVHTIVTAGTPGWLIALIAVAAAALAATLAVLADRALAARSRPATTVA